LINGLGSLFATSEFLEAANFTITPSLITVGQFTGITFLFLAILSWKIPIITGEAIVSLGKNICPWARNVACNHWISGWYLDRSPDRLLTLI
jgi:ribosome modulation factor